MATTTKGTGYTMVKAKDTSINGTPRIQLNRHVAPPKSNTQPSLLLIRLKELDREFYCQTKHLARITKEIRRKIIEKM